jgi:hypothetical protein
VTVPNGSGPWNPHHVGVDDLNSLRAIHTFLSRTFTWKKEHPGRALPALVEHPDELIIRALVVEGGVARARLRRMLPVGQWRFDEAIERLQAAGAIEAVLKVRPDLMGRNRKQWTWMANDGRSPP